MGTVGTLIKNREEPEGWRAEDYTTRELRQQEILADAEWSRKIKAALQKRSG